MNCSDEAGLRGGGPLRVVEFQAILGIVVWTTAVRMKSLTWTVDKGLASVASISQSMQCWLKVANGQRHTRTGLRPVGRVLPCDVRE